jgi:D-alanyl-D-alanine carboxypeptidase/D-alanyl-D-alanine-endopeptidase (penicillin-binding protein 4)
MPWPQAHGVRTLRSALTLVGLLAGVAVACLCAASAHAAALHARRPSAQARLVRILRGQMRRAGRSSGALVIDLSTGRTLFSSRAGTPRLPASVEKLYTTSTALLRFGATARLTTRVYGSGRLVGHTWVGDLYLKGGGDPSFGSASFDHLAYGGGSTMQGLVSNLLAASGIRALEGRIIGDASYFDSERGTPASDGRANFYVEGQLSALAYDRGFTSIQENAFQPHPVLFAARAFASALRADGVSIPKRTPINAGRTPSGARALAVLRSPPMATLVRWTNTPSDNFFAEMLLKGLGARFGSGGSTAAGAAVVRSELAETFGLHPTFDDGSGLSYADHTSPRQVLTLLSKMASDPAFVDSLAIAGESGTLQYEMNGTVAQGRCRAKTGTLQAVSNMAGYCTAADGHTLAFAFLMNAINPLDAHPLQDRMAEALAAYDG